MTIDELIEALENFKACNVLPKDTPVLVHDPEFGGDARILSADLYVHCNGCGRLYVRLKLL